MALPIRAFFEIARDLDVSRSTLHQTLNQPKDAIAKDVS